MRLDRPKEIGLKQVGFSLIELMVSMIVGLLILAAVTSIFVSMLNSNNDNLKSMRLNQDLRAAMSLMTRNIRRSGVNQDSENLPSSGSNQFQGVEICSGTTPDTTVPITGDRIIFSYDEAGTVGGTPDADEWFGYQYNSTDKDIKIGITGPGASCALSNWTSATDNTQVAITNLQFLETQIPASFTGGTPERQIAVTITGQLVSDASFQRTLTETVYIRNN